MPRGILFFLVCALLPLSHSNSQTIWDSGEDLTQLSGGDGWPWRTWSASDLKNWKYYEGLGPVWQWKDTNGNLLTEWVYSFFHGWIYPQGDNLSSIWLYSMKYNTSWIWTSSSDFTLVYFNKVTAFYQYDKDSYGQDFLALDSATWYHYRGIPGLFPKDFSSVDETTPPMDELVRVAQGEYSIGGVTPAEPYNDENDNGKFDDGESFEDLDADGTYDSKIGYDDEYPRHPVSLASYYIFKTEITNQLWNFIVEWAQTRPDKEGDEFQEFYKYRFDSDIYLNYDTYSGYLQRWIDAIQAYQANPTQVNQDKVDSTKADYEAQLQKRDEKWQVILQHRIDNPNMPVSYVSWFDVLKWCNAYSEYMERTPEYYVDPGLGGVLRSSSIARTDYQALQNYNNGYVKWDADGFRLPTETEWEVAAIGGRAGKPYATGDFIDDTMANILPSDGSGELLPVAQFPPNDYGLFDMSGNHQEWCWDWKADYDDASAGFTLDLRDANQVLLGSYKVTIPDLGVAKTPAEAATEVDRYLQLFNSSANIEASLSGDKLSFRNTGGSPGTYLVVHSLDINAKNVLGLREMDSSVPIAVTAPNEPVAGWIAPANFSIDFTSLESGAAGTYNVTVQPPSSGTGNTSLLYSYMGAVNTALQSLGMGHLYACAPDGNKLSINFQRGQHPQTFTVRTSPGDPFTTNLGFQESAATSLDSSALVFEAFNILRPFSPSQNPRGPGAGTKRVFRGGFYSEPAFLSRVSTRSSYTPFIPTKRVGLRPVIGLPWDDR